MDNWEIKSSLEKDFRHRTFQKKMEKVWHWFWLCFFTAAAVILFWCLITDLVYPRQALPQVHAMTMRQEQAQYWNTLAMMKAEASTTLSTTNK